MLSRNDKIFFGKEIFEDCEIFVEKYVARDGQLYFTAFVCCKVSKLPERYQDIKTVIGKMIEIKGTFGYHYIFGLTFVSQVFTVWTILYGACFLIQISINQFGHWRGILKRT